MQDKSGQFHFSRVEETSRTFFANFESTFNALESLYKLISLFFSAAKFSLWRNQHDSSALCSPAKFKSGGWLKVCTKCSTSFFHTREMKLTWLILHLLAHVKVPTSESLCKLFLSKILLKLTTIGFHIWPAQMELGFTCSSYKPQLFYQQSREIYALLMWMVHIYN